MYYNLKQRRVLSVSRIPGRWCKKVEDWMGSWEDQHTSTPSFRSQSFLEGGC